MPSGTASPYASPFVFNKVPFTAVNQAATALKPFLTGQGFPGGATPAFALPTQARITGIVGTNASS